MKKDDFKLPFEILGIEQTVNEELIKIAYEQQLKHAQTEEDIFKIRAAYDEAMRYSYEEQEKEFSEETLFTGDELEREGNSVDPSSHNFEDPNPDDLLNTDLNPN